MNLTAIAFGLCALLAGALFWQHQAARTDHLQMQAKIDMANVARDAWKFTADANAGSTRTAVAANTSLQGAVDTLKDELAESQRISDQAKADGAAALRELSTARQTLRAAAAREAATRGQIYATDPLCVAWAATPVCPAIADRLRATSRGSPPS